jgi:hypothetical protein
MAKGAGASKQALDHLAKGTYQRVDFSATENFAAGTEVVVTSMSDNICTPTAVDEAMYSWVRWTGFIFDTGLWCIFEYAVIRCDHDDALQDLNDEAAVEDLHREGRILMRDFVMQPTPSYGRLKELELEFYNVKLLPDEELRLILRPLFDDSGVDAIRVAGIVEWRQVGK